MRQKNWRVAITGIVLIVIAVGFYFFMFTVAPKSNDPAALMSPVGTVAGIMCGLDLAMIVVGLIGKGT